MKLLFTTPMALLVLAAGCLGTETGNPPLTGEMAVDAHSSDPATAALRSSEGGIAVDGVWLGTGEIRFVTVADCDEAPTGIANVAPLAVDNHANTGALRAPLAYDVVPYCRMILPLARQEGALPSGAPASLAGSTLVLTGTSSGGARFEVVVASERTIDLDAVLGEMSFAEGEGFVFLGFDVGTWFAGVDLDGGTPSADGTIVLSATDNASLFATFEANANRGFELYLDLDRDGEPDSPEPIARGVP